MDVDNLWDSELGIGELSGVVHVCTKTTILGFAQTAAGSSLFDVHYLVGVDDTKLL